MKMNALKEFLIILTVSLFGELLRYLIPLSIPAGIYGLLLMFAGLCTKIIPLKKVEHAADFLIEIMPVFLIPAGVALMTKWLELKSVLLPVLLSVFVITLIVLVITGVTTQKLVERKGPSDE